MTDLQKLQELLKIENKKEYFSKDFTKINSLEKQIQQIYFNQLSDIKLKLSERFTGEELINETLQEAHNKDLCEVEDNNIFVFSEFEPYDLVVNTNKYKVWRGEWD